MSNPEVKNKKPSKKKLAEAIYTKMDIALLEYRDFLNSNKTIGELKN